MSGAGGGVAIVGLAGRFPGARDPGELWRHLRGGVESITFFSREELDAEGVDRELYERPDYVPAKAVLEDVDRFDAAFFGFTPGEAELTDPQHRLFLETCWLALEDAGCDPGRHPGSIGLFGGAGVASYLLRNLASNPRRVAAAGMLQTLIHNKNDHLCTRVAYKLGLSGPCVTVQTACSTSLVAVALACQSLVDYQCDLALAGGSTVVLPARSGYLYQEGGVASPDGHCRPFDAAAAGTVDGDGVGVVVMKRLDEALAEGDPVRAVIRGWAVNNDGAEKAGYTAPSLERQAEVIALAQGLAEVGPETIGYVEAHGTATPLGDPVEVAALTRAFRRRGGALRGYCALGSIKSNVGHLDTAAGVAGLIKTVLALEHREIPPTLHFRKPNPRLELDSSPFYVNAELRPWPRGATPRRAGVSSFGIGGTNAHVVLEEAPPFEARAAAAPERRFQVLTLSARTPSALESASETLAAHLGARPDLDLADIAYTLQSGRKRFDHRRTVLCRDLADATEALETLVPERVSGRSQGPVDRPVVFMFPGQGCQYPGMGEELYAAEPGFRRRLDHCAERLAPHLGLDLRGVLFPAAGERDAARGRLDRTLFTQPALFAVEHALAGLWMDWGVTPRALVGHSLGELTAACVAGVMDLEDALRLIATRARLIESLPEGAMLSVALPEHDALTRIGPALELAAVNGPSLCALSGPAEAIDELARRLDAEGVATRRLRTSRAFHSRAMEPILGVLAEEVAGISLNEPEIPFFSNTSGTWITAAEATDPGYWARHLRRPVRFNDAVESLLEEPDAVLLEVGPGRTLKTLTRWHPKKTPGQVVETSLPHPDDGVGADEALHGAVGRLWLSGVEIDWRAYHGEGRRRVHLPGYPFERRRYWIEARAPAEAARPAAGLEKIDDLGKWLYVPVWRETPPLGTRTPGERAAAPVLVFADRLGVGAAVAERLRRQGASCTVVEPDPAFERPGAYRELLAGLGRRGETPERAVHLWNVGAVEPAATAGGAWAALRDRAFFSLLHLAQAWGEEMPGAPLSLWVVSSGLASLAGEVAPEPEKATLLGPVKVIPREYREIACRGVDVALPASARERSRLAGQLLAELAEPAERLRREPVVALRDGHRWAQGYEPLSFADAADANAASRLRPGACYLITGGLGGVGLAVAGLLAERCQARLALLGRSPFPEPETWDAWLASHGEDDPTRRTIERLRRFEAAGAEVLVLAADVTDEEQVSVAVARVRASFGRLDGVFHAAGIAGGGLIRKRSREAAASVFAPKVIGARVLEAALADDLPELWVLFSSLAGVVGRPGQVDYCAANAFLDAFARDLGRRAGVHAVAVDWCEWHETGMAAAGTLPPTPAGAAGFEDIDRPLLDRRRLLPSGEEVYATDFDVHRHWVIDEHRLVGHPVIPGVAYVEMLLEALGERARGRTVELADFHFLAPLRVPDGERREVRLRLVPEGGGFSFSVESDAGVDEGVVPGVREYALGRVRLLPEAPVERRDLEAIRAACGEREEVFTDEQREDDLGPRWQNVRRAWIGGRRVLTHLALPEDFAGDFERLAYHPSMMDRAAGVAKEYLYEGAYLPLSYETLRIRAPVPREIYTWARHRPEADPTLETLTYDTLVLDPEGRVLVELEGFTQKLVTEAAVKIKSYAGHGGWGRSLRRPPPAGETREERREMLPEEGIEVLRRILAGPPAPQVVVSARDLYAVIERADEAILERVLEEAAETAAAAVHPRPALDTEYIAPETDLEKRLAAAWREALGIERVGTRDDFFELGGDSVQAIQILAALRRDGIELSPQQFFQRRTIAQLAGDLAGDAATQKHAIGPRPDGALADSDSLFPLAELDEAGLDHLAGLLEEADRGNPD